MSKTDESNLRGFPWGKVFKANLLENIRFPEGYWFEDTICSYLLFPLSDIKVTIEDIVYRYRKNSQGITNTSRGNYKVIDTLYVTESLIKDARDFDFFDTDRFYEKQFDQMRINFSRISTLNNSKINESCFVIYCDIFRKYFSNKNLRSNNYKIKEIEYALRNNNYALYNAIVYLL
ncbi:hypothetical protein [Ornithobacterium rhinotracheale]|uniref:hypothetical protein n=1 Tax=Ornithobacterium rhinotracheale TaxID=28251 RepID=UPI001FF2224E|nr:hypothetical protein [Ornithobacterium rhinotracheale]MCK0205495.1 hypothetical protein [Ornithobacterium rhinotracheale]